MVTIAQSRSRVMTHTRAPFLSWLMLWAGGLAALLFLAVVAWRFHFQGQIYPGVMVGHVSVGAETMQAASRTLAMAYPPEPSPPIEVEWEGQRWLLPARLLIRVYDTESVLTAAYSVGRVGPLQQQLVTQARTALYGTTLPVPSALPESSARVWLNRLAARLYRPVREPSLRLSAGGLQFSPGAPGREVDVHATWQRIQEAIRAREKGAPLAEPVSLVVREPGPRTLDVQPLEGALQRLAYPLILDAGDRTLSLDPETISKVITVTPRQDAQGNVFARVEVDREKLRAALQKLADRYNTPAVDARLDYDPASDSFIVLVPSEEGWAIDVDGAVEVVAKALEEGKQEVAIPAGPVRPRVPSDATPAELGIREIVGEGTTYFRGSSRARVRNIVRAAEAVRGVVIPPGEVFSFNDAAGAITAANGYEDSLIIWGDRTAVGIGGGVCQVSTTLYRAAFFGGLPIVERWNHGYIVSWYGEPGFDATVYSPYVDFKFKNTTDAYLLVQPIVDTERGVLTFRLWGTDPGWTVEVGDPVREDVQEPPPPAYQEDPSLPTGTIKQVEWAKPGMVVRVHRVVRKGDTVLDDQEFVSRYQPWRALYLYGPGTEVPKGDE